MKLAIRLYLIVSLILLSVLLFGCKTVPDLAYIPLNLADNRLSSVPPLKIKLVKFVDKRIESNDATIIGKKQRSQQESWLYIYLKKPHTEMIWDAFRT